MIHANASIMSMWQCLMHDIIIEIREKACAHIHHLEISTQEWKCKQLSAIIQRIYERRKGGLAAPEANGMKISQIKWKLFLFGESDFFHLRPVYLLFSFN